MYIELFMYSAMCSIDFHPVYPVFINLTSLPQNITKTVKVLSATWRAQSVPKEKCKIKKIAGEFVSTPAVIISRLTFVNFPAEDKKNCFFPFLKVSLAVYIRVTGSVYNQQAAYAKRCSFDHTEYLHLLILAHS